MAASTALTLPVDPTGLLGGFLAFMRASAWLVVTPPFNSRSIPMPAKVALAGGLAIAASGQMAGGPLPTDTATLIGATVIQVVTGLGLGMIVNILLSSVQSAGTFLGLFGGFSLPSAYDPMSEEQTSVVGQTYGLMAVTLLFVLDAHVFLVRGFMQSFSAVGISLHSMGGLEATLVHDLSVFFLSALEMAAPLLAVLFMAQVVLGLLAKAAPQLNVFVLGLPFQVLLTMLLIGIGIRIIPGFLTQLVTQSVSDASHLVRGLL